MGRSLPPSDGAPAWPLVRAGRGFVVGGRKGVGLGEYLRSDRSG